MKDTDLYQHVLGLREPWSVSQVELDIKSQRVDVWVEHPKDLKWPCPDCDAEGAVRGRATDGCTFTLRIMVIDPSRRESLSSLTIIASTIR